MGTEETKDRKSKSKSTPPPTKRKKEKYLSSKKKIQKCFAVNPLSPVLFLGDLEFSMYSFFIERWLISQTVSLCHSFLKMSNFMSLTHFPEWFLTSWPTYHCSVTSYRTDMWIMTPGNGYWRHRVVISGSWRQKPFPGNSDVLATSCNMEGPADHNFVQN